MHTPVRTPKPAFISSRRFQAAALTLGLGLVSSAWGPTATAQLPSFPGAQGAGAFAKGGRGGDVYHVTNTNASGSGSLANGIATIPTAGRTIVFDVSGYAHISGTVRITKNKVTIAGQTAPGDGFGLKDGTFLVSSDDVIVRHLRVRDGNSADAINVDSNSINSMFDHIDAMFSNDENFSSFKAAPENLTFQWSMNAWGMESHSAGGLWDQNHASAHHTLWSHNHTRNPKARPEGCLDWINNVTFDWDIGFIMGDSDTPANWRANVIGCYFVCPTGNIRSVALESAHLDRTGVPNFSVFLSDCKMDNNGNGVLDTSKTGFSLISGSSYIKSPTRFVNNGIPVTAEDPLTAYKKVLSAAGPLRLEADPTKPLRDELNTLLVSNVLNQRRKHVTAPANTGASNGGFGFLNSITPPRDTDQDGMPDYYESAIGSSTTTATNNVQVPTGAYLPASPAGYTLLEDYLQFLGMPHAVVPKNGSVDIDLRKFTPGFTKATILYALSSVSNGTATLQPNGSTVHFTPTAGFAGRAKFNFRVTDGDGSTWSQTFAVLATAGSLPSPWSTRDIGAVGAVGAANYANNFAVTGSGNDIWGTADECRYVFQPASGDCSIVARVTSLQNTNARSKAGVMIRETLNGDSRQAFVGLTPGVGAEFIRRATTAGASTSAGPQAGFAAPYWVRLTRAGNTFTAGISANGTTWTTTGTTTITMGASVSIGLAVNSHADGTQCTATFSDVSVTP